MNVMISDSMRSYVTCRRRTSVDSAVSLRERIGAVEDFAEIAARLLIIGELEWAAVDADYRLLVINSALRRQLESVRAAILLARNDLGHLAVAFVRASVEDVMYLTFFVRLDLAASQKMFQLLGNLDSWRSLLAQRKYVGDEVMKQLWYPEAFLNAAVKARDAVKAELQKLQKQYKWSGGIVPSADWIAKFYDGYASISVLKGDAYVRIAVGVANPLGPEKALAADAVPRM